jgi:hypothetical protein
MNYIKRCQSKYHTITITKTNFVITLISSTNKTDHHDLTVKLLKVVLSTINQTKIKLVNNQEIILSQIQNLQIATPLRDYNL